MSCLGVSIVSQSKYLIWFAVCRQRDIICAVRQDCWPYGVKSLPLHCEDLRITGPILSSLLSWRRSGAPVSPPLLHQSSTTDPRPTDFRHRIHHLNSSTYSLETERAHLEGTWPLCLRVRLFRGALPRHYFRRPREMQLCKRAVTARASN